MIVISISTFTNPEKIVRFFVKFIPYGQFLLTRSTLYDIHQDYVFFCYKITACASNSAAQMTSNETKSINDTKYAWKYEFAYNDMAERCVLDDEAMDRVTLRRLRYAVLVARNVSISELDDEAPTAINLLRLFWNEKVFLKITSDFQLPDSGLKKNPTVDEGTRFLSVVLKDCFYTCASFDELYHMENEYGKTDNLMEKEIFMACLLYTSPSPRDQRGSRMPSSA